MTKRAAILVGKLPPADLPALIDAGDHPRVEYFELAARWNAELLDFGAVESSGMRSVRWVGRRLGPYWGLAWLAFLRRREFDIFYATGEDVGMRLGVFLRAAREREKLVALVHNAGTPKRRAWLRLLGDRIYARVLCFGSAQYRVLTEEIGLPEDKVHPVQYWCDQRFYQPDWNRTGTYVLSVGLESRDYATLRAAAEGLDYPFQVVASGWSPGPGFGPADGVASRANITVGRGYSARELRDLYAGARFVVVPLKAVSSAAGITSIVEGMAMGKAIVASASPGVLDFVKDKVSGRLVPVGDSAALRDAIVDLWEHPQRAAVMGQHNRKWIEDTINIDRYVARAADFLAG